jgi:hypothetical protein
MHTPRWFLMASGILLLNLLAVITTSYLRHAQATEPPTATPGAAATPSQATAPGKADSQTRTAGNDATQVQPLASTTAPNPLDNIPIPDQMPEIPSLADPDILKHDPGFQEFRRLFALEEESWDSAPPLLGAEHSAAASAQYFESLDQRLETVEKLCSAARSIAHQAAQQARNGGTEQSQELIRMTTQLRDMAAKLLVSEL